MANCYPKFCRQMNVENHSTEQLTWSRNHLTQTLAGTLTLSFWYWFLQSECGLDWERKPLNGFHLMGTPRFYTFYLQESYYILMVKSEKKIPSWLWQEEVKVAIWKYMFHNEGRLSRGRAITQLQATLESPSVRKSGRKVLNILVKVTPQARSLLKDRFNPKIN